MKPTVEAFEQIAEASLALMGEELGGEDRGPFREELQKHVDALALIGVGGAGGAQATCRITRIWISCPTRVMERNQASQGGEAEGGSANTTALAFNASAGPIRWGGGSCIPMGRCFVCYEYECSPT